MVRQPLQDRLAMLVNTLDPGTTTDGQSLQTLWSRLAGLMDSPENDVVWLTLAVLRSELPQRSDVVALRRRLRLEDPNTVVRQIAQRARWRTLVGSKPHSVRIVSNAVVVDVHHTARTGLATGIQRVVRRTIAEWISNHDVLLVGWDDSYRGLRELSPRERQNAAFGTAPDAREQGDSELLIPWRSTFVLPELAIEDDRTARIAALAEFSGNRSCVIGFDCVPLTSGETVGAGMGAAFARNLVAVAQFDRVATISEAAAIEYRGWRTMLGSAGLSGPEIDSVILPTESGSVSADDQELARAELMVDGKPLVLCVGSHEPRKNHLAVLAAAEILWQKGRDFSLAFVGGNSWGSESFTDLVGDLRERGRPVRTISAITDPLLWGGYEIARCTVFPSLNEGFGLPVGESLELSTPVVTSRYGSMKEIAVDGGAILVDPRDDDDVAAGIERALFDDECRARLIAEAAARPKRTWEDYASEVWAYFMKSKDAAETLQRESDVQSS